MPDPLALPSSPLDAAEPTPPNRLPPRFGSGQADPKFQQAVSALAAQPSWLEQARALKQNEDWRSLRPSEERIEFATGMVGPSALTTETAIGKSVLAAGRKRASITAINLRNMPLDEAMEIASMGEHIIAKKEGGFVGAPAWVQTEADLQLMRQRFDQRVRKGLLGAPWYSEAQAGIKQTAGPDPRRQHLQARELALTSSQAAPDPNLGFTLQAHNAYEMGSPLSIVRTGQIARSYRSAREAERDIPLGKKTGVYAGHLDPTLEDPTTGTNDIWHARAFGYSNADGTPWSKALTAQQHAFMDAETVLAVKRANEVNLGGRSNWTPGEIQAAPWVAGKAEGLLQQRPSLSPEQAAAEAAKTYPAYFPKYTAHGTYEATPGIGTGHLENIAAGPEALRAQYSASPLSQWTDPHGRDVLYDVLGGYQRETLPATGVFQSEGGPMEINPANVARPLVGMTGKSGARVMDPASRQMLRTAEGTRAYIDVQNMGAASKPILGNQVRRSNSIWVPHNQKMTIEQIGELNALGEKIGLPNVIDYGEGIVLTNFAGAEPKAISKALKDAGFYQQLQTILPGRPVLAELDSVTIDYAKAFSKQGTGAATKLLRKQIPNDAVLNKLDASKELRDVVLNRFNRDALAAVQGGGIAREDVQLARDIIVKEGFSGLFAALKRGAALPAALLPIAAGAVASLKEDQGG